jgi:hypothetical protein
VTFRFDIDNVYVIIEGSMVRLHEYLDASGRNEYRMRTEASRGEGSGKE